ncbi:MAG: hypothetical protein JXB39_07595 [Deltaproteobacteria bacterium]|nr:hypothetical protein [Deltaproteobacteria bacterium]
MPGSSSCILGLHVGVDAGAALLAEDRIVAAANEERFSRTKFQWGFPGRSVEAVLRTAGIDGREVSRVVLAGTAHSPPSDINTYAITPGGPMEAALRVLGRLGLQRGLLGSRPGLAVYRAAFGAARRVEIGSLRRRLADLGVRAPLVRVDHHAAHAASAAYTCGWDRALVLTADQMGDGSSATIWRKEGSTLDPVLRVPVFHSLGILYFYVTLLLGFQPGREGKVMGLAARGNAAATGAIFRQFVDFDARTGGFVNHARGLVADYDALAAQLRPFSREDVCAGVQAHFEACVSALVRHHVERTGLDRLAVAGGVFSNVRMNGVLRTVPGIAGTWVFPHMGDGGLAAGAALHAAHPQAADALPSLFLGPASPPEEITLGSGVREGPEAEAEAVRLLAEGRIVGRFEGRMEYGPRALGNRSVLCAADDPAANDRLNRMLRRSEFMPFAPTVLEEDAPAILEGWRPDHASSRHMTTTYRVTLAGRALAPAVVHVDGTARPQVLRAEDNPGYHRLLCAFKARTGSGVLLNTSMNVHEEPIVFQASDALRLLGETGLDGLLLEGRWVTGAA